jgi:hypothetical protein
MSPQGGRREPQRSAQLMSLLSQVQANKAKLESVLSTLDAKTTETAQDS